MSAFEDIDEASQRVLRRLRADKPEWLRFASVDAVSPDLKTLRISIPAVSPMDSIGLTVDGDELTVWASVHHVHIGIGEITDKDISDAFELLDEIIADKTLVVSVWKGDRLRLSSFEDACKPSQWHGEPPGDHRLMVHSWSGQSDVERSISWPGWIRSIRRAFTG